MDLFDAREKKMSRKLKNSGSLECQEPCSEIYIRIVLPAEKTTAIGRSRLDCQPKPKVTLIDLELQRMKEANTKRKRRVPVAEVVFGNKDSKKPRKVAPSGEKTARQISEKSKNILPSGQV